MKYNLFARITDFFRKTEEDNSEVPECIGDLGDSTFHEMPVCSDAGNDSAPLPDDIAVAVYTPVSGSHAVVAFVDLRNRGTAEPGEKRLYSRNQGGDVVAEVHLKNDGSIEVKNNAGSLTLLPSGDVQISNNLIVDGDIEATNVIADTEVTAGLINLTTHTHTSSNPGNPTSPPLP